VLGVNSFYESLAKDKQQQKQKKLKSFVNSSLQEARWCSSAACASATKPW